MQAKTLCDRLGASLREIALAPADFPASMWDLLSAIERARLSRSCGRRRMLGRRPTLGSRLLAKFPGECGR